MGTKHFNGQQKSCSQPRMRLNEAAPVSATGHGQPANDNGVNGDEAWQWRCWYWYWCGCWCWWRRCWCWCWCVSDSLVADRMCLCCFVSNDFKQDLRSSGNRRSQETRQLWLDKWPEEERVKGESVEEKWEGAGQCPRLFSGWVMRSRKVIEGKEVVVSSIRLYLMLKCS